MNRPAVPGFGALFVLGVAKALARPLSAAELLAPSTRAPTPPKWCPCCCSAVVEPSRVDGGAWAWSCAGGCNS